MRIDTSARPGVSRRRFMQLAASTATGTLLPALPLPAVAQPLDLESFLSLSAAATGHQRLDPVLGNAILDALGRTGALAEVEGLNADADSPARRALIRAWYLGKVGPDGIEADDDDIERQQAEDADDEEEDEAPDIVVGYEATLMGRVVSDMIPLRSYCGGLPHFWTQPPDDPDVAAGGASS